MNFGELKTYVYTNLGRDSSDAIAVSIVPAAINFAIACIGTAFKPYELETSNSVTLPTAGSVSISALDYLDIVRVYNSTDSIDMHFIPFELWNLVAGTPAATRYWSMFNRTLYGKVAPAANKTLTVFYYKFPTTLSANETSPDFSHFDGLIISLATTIAQAVFEEEDSSKLWAQIVNILGGFASREGLMQGIIGARPAFLEPIAAALGVEQQQQKKA